jgi:hypothetical protein
MVERMPWWLIGLIVFVLAEVIVGLFVLALCQLAGRSDDQSEVYAELLRREPPRRVRRLRESCGSTRRR